MLENQPEEFSYEYLVMLDGEELAAYFSNAMPPEVGTLLDPWEFVAPEVQNEKRHHLKGPYRVIQLVQQPKSLDGGEVSTQAFIHIVVEKQ
jgi:hypothetical protein